MHKHLLRCTLAAVGVAAAMLMGGPSHAGPVSTDDLMKAQDNGAEWLMYGRDYRNWRYSPTSPR